MAKTKISREVFTKLASMKSNLELDKKEPFHVKVSLEFTMMDQFSQKINISIANKNCRTDNLFNPCDYLTILSKPGNLVDHSLESGSDWVQLAVTEFQILQQITTPTHFGLQRRKFLFLF